MVDVGAQPASSPDKINSALDVVGQMQSLLGWEAIRRQRESISGRDVLIEPDITNFSVTAFNELEMGIERGREAAQKMGDKLAPLSISNAEWATYLAQRKARTNPAPIRLDRVEIANTSTIDTRYIAPLVTTKPGDTLDGAVMATQVANIFALDAFERVDYHVDVAPAGNTLVVNARGTRGSTKYFQTGLAISSDFGNTSQFDFAVAYTNRDFLGTGAEWRGFMRVGNDVTLDVSLYKQLGRFFVEPLAYYERYSAVLTRQGSEDVINTLQVARAGAGIDGGVLFGNWGELRVGGRLGGINPNEDNFAIELPAGWIRDVELRAAFTYDTLNSLTFPTSGTYGQIRIVDHVKALGGNFTRSVFTLNMQKPFSVGPATVVLGGRLGTTNNAVEDFIGDNRLGGFLNLSGLSQNSLIGQQVLFGRAVGFYRLSEKAPIFDIPIFVGGSFEAGNVWAKRSDISIGNFRTAASAFIAAETPIGPVWFALGQSHDDTSIYLVLGRVF